MITYLATTLTSPRSTHNALDRAFSCELSNSFMISFRFEKGANPTKIYGNISRECDKSKTSSTISRRWTYRCGTSVIGVRPLYRSVVAERYTNPSSVIDYDKSGVRRRSHSSDRRTSSTKNKR